jgi:YHS domain-containing protein
MKKSILTVLLITAAFSVFAEPQTTCPVMKGRNINKELYVDVEGYRIYVCCKGCINAVKANPEKYIEKAQADGVEFEKAPEK